MQKIFLGLILFISPLLLFSHNSLSAIYSIEGISNGNVLNINLTQSAVNKALRDIYGVEFLEKTGEKKLKELIVNYIKENFNLKINNSTVELTKGGIRYGSHQTDLTFITSKIPKKINTIELEITAFKNNEGHHNMFFYNRDGLSEKVILSSKNNFKSTKNFNQSNNSNYLKIIILLITVSIITFLVIVSIRKKRKLLKLKQYEAFLFIY